VLNVKRNFCRVIAAMVFCCVVGRSEWPSTLSQYGPLSVARQSLFGMNGLEISVRARVRSLPYYGVFDHVSYRVSGRHIVLSGEVVHPELRHDAEVAVKEIDEGLEVSSQIRDLTDSPAENEIRKAIFVAIYTNREMRPYAFSGEAPIHIVVEADHVLLEGEVTSDHDRQLATLLAKSIHGVKSVDNQLTVSW
jgi:hypothetical protein